MSMKKKTPLALCLNDWHVGKSTINESIANWNEALNYCVEHSICKIKVGGDIFLSRVSQTLPVLMAVKQCFAKADELGIEVIAAPGNHDKINLEDTISYPHLYEGMPRLTIVDDYHYSEYANVVIHMMAYFPEDGSFKKRLSKVEIIEGKKNILYIHEGINGALGHSTGDNKELPTDIFEKFDVVLVGHYHNRKQIPGTNIHYIGSSRQHNFGEDTAKGYAIIYSDGSFSYVDNAVNDKYITYEEDFSNIDQLSFEQIKEYREEGYKVRVIINCVSKQVKLIKKKDFVDAGASKVTVVVDRSDAKDVKQTSGAVRFNKSGLVSNYKEFCEEKGNDPELGLKYIKDINL